MTDVPRFRPACASRSVDYSKDADEAEEEGEHSSDIGYDQGAYEVMQELGGPVQTGPFGDDGLRDDDRIAELAGRDGGGASYTFGANGEDSNWSRSAALFQSASGTCDTAQDHPTAAFSSSKRAAKAILADESRNPFLDNGEEPPVPGPSASYLRPHAYAQRNRAPTLQDKSEYNQRLARLSAEIKSVDEQIRELEALRESLKREKEEVEREAEGAWNAAAARASAFVVEDGRGKAKGKERSIDYMKTGWEWDADVKATLSKVWGIHSFRLCQEGVVNAALHNRHLVVVMPTGGGKSLTYQLPAVLTHGTTLVISPLISLISDQIIHLHEAGVNAVMLTGSTSREETTRILRTLAHGGKGRNIKGDRKGIRAMHMDEDEEEEGDIKLVYVTPEKVAQSKRFLGALEKVAQAGRLSRIVIDEAHCCSQMGHDFRPDYRKLTILRKVCPTVPVMCLTATCGPKVLRDLIKVLQLPPITDGRSANTTGTIFFSAPLYRENLRYGVALKPSSSQAAIAAIADWILKFYPSQSGIVYCLSQKDSEGMAAGLEEMSGRKIRTGIYHADRPAEEKEAIHERWRSGKLHVVCATIAFGMGIDKADVRFVIHHSLSRSIESYYQETGRAGRDGNIASCLLWYRAQDATRMTSLLANDVEGQQKIRSMLRYAQSTLCRKRLFSDYFGGYSSTVSSFDPGGPTECGHCDNCTLEKQGEPTDFTFQAWKILKVLEKVDKEGGRLTLGQLVDLVRGLGGASFTVSRKSEGRRSKVNEKEQLDLQAIVGGKVALTKEVVEYLLVEMFLQGYLEESYGSTAYSINSYLVPSPRVIRFTRLTLPEAQRATGLFTVSLHPALTGKSTSMSSSRSNARETPTTGKKIKGKRTGDVDGHVLSGDDDDGDETPVRATAPRRETKRVLSSSSEGGSEWEVVASTASRPPAKAARRNSGRKAKNAGRGPVQEVVEVSD